MDQIVNDAPVEEFEMKLKKIIANIEKLPSKTKEIFDLIVTPGIRLKNDDKNDQKNVATPNFAIIFCASTSAAISPASLALDNAACAACKPDVTLPSIAVT